jgi:hypothetical protein
VRARPGSALLVSLALMLLIGGCGGPSPETRARWTRTALLGTRTQVPPVQPSTEILTAEASLPIAPPPIVIGTIGASAGSAMTGWELTEELNDSAMAKAETRVCTGSDRCYALPSDVETARARCTPKGRCRVGLLVGGGGRESFDVWLEVATGLVKLIPQTDA